jgi:ubiquitin carboxyl-terminal hydrolase 7
MDQVSNLDFAHSPQHFLALNHINTRGMAGLDTDLQALTVDDAQIGSDMVVDHEYDEKHDVAIITPDTDDQMDEVDAEPEPRADEFDAFMKKHMPELVDQETEAETYHTWEIKDWRTLTRREHGPLFECGGHPWRILMFPYGNNVDFASFYLEQGYEDKQMPEDWYACVQFMLVHIYHAYRAPPLHCR